MADKPLFPLSMPNVKFPVDYVKLKITIAVLMLIAVLAVCSVAIAALVVNATYTIVQKNCVRTGNNSFLGTIGTDTNGPSFDWDLQYMSGGPTINSIEIRGPMPPGSLVGPSLIALCGTPSTLACDVSIASVLKGSVKEYNGVGVKNLIATLRDKPAAFYVLINGGNRMELGNLC